MGGYSNPVNQQLSRNIIESLAARGASPQQDPGPMGASPGDTEKSLSQRMAELRGADPGMVMRKLNQMKKDCVELIPQVAFTIPALAKHLSAVLKGLDGALKEAEQGANVEKSISQGPISHSAAGTPQPQPGEGPMMGAPAIGAGM